MGMTVLLDPAYRWKQISYGLHEVAFAGRRGTTDDFLHGLSPDRDWDSNEVLRALHGLVGSFAFIVCGPQRTWAVADRIRGYPVFYSSAGGFSVSNSARMLKDHASLAELDPIAVHEFRQAGYVTGADTLYKGLQQLQAGELVMFDQGTGQTITHRYFRFFSPILRNDSDEALLTEHDHLTEAVFNRVIERAGGRPIWVPLSGGLDSRFILCKLHEFGYGNLHAFSYGSPGNYEAKAAKTVADRLGVPWLFVPCRVRECRTFFWSETRSRFSLFADALCCVPNYMDLYPLSVLIEQKRIAADAVIINGQSGDFISGGHIPAVLQEESAGLDDVLACVDAKHFTLWTDDKGRAGMGPVHEKLRQVFAEVGQLGRAPHAMARLYEYWECQERQCKFVIAGQRVYDFLGFDWDLPLWQEEYLNFWKDIPVPVKAGQRLYKEYLWRYDYRGLFRGFTPKIWDWPGWSMIFLGLSRLAGWLGGQAGKETFYVYTKYFGKYRSYFGVYPYAEYLGLAKYHRNPFSFYVRTWLESNLDGEYAPFPK